MKAYLAEPLVHTNLHRGFRTLLLPMLVLGALLGAIQPAVAYDVNRNPALRPAPSPLRLQPESTGVVTVSYENNQTITNTDFPVSVVWEITSMRIRQDGVLTTVETCAEAGVSFVDGPTATAMPTGGCVRGPVAGSSGSQLPASVYVLFTKPASIEVRATVNVTGGQPALVVTTEVNATTLQGPTDPSIQGMKPDPLITTFGHVTIRSRDLLGYALRMKQDLTSDASENPIYQMYSRSRQVANVLFIVALMLIAFFYNFAILISRERLRRLLVLFTIAIIGVNFSYTIASVAIQGSDRLFNVLLVRDDTEAVGGDGSVTTVAGGQVSEDDLLTMRNFTYSGFVGAVKVDPVDVNRAGEARDMMTNNRYRENIFFNLALMTAGAIGQFLIVLVLLARIMILWALIIVAPFFFLLAIFKFSQEIFKYWGWFFFRWLLIGPLLALFLSANVRIWTSSIGIPISSTFDRANANTFFPNILNIWVGAPGVRGAEGLNLETPDQVIRYLMGLIMLYLAVLLPFWLTRRITVFSPDKPSLLSKLLGGAGARQKSSLKTREPQSPSPTPLKSGFTFNEAAAGAAAKVGAAAGVAAAGSVISATLNAAASATERGSLASASAGAAKGAGTKTSAEKTSRSAVAEAIRRGASRRLASQMDAGVTAASIAALTAQGKPRAVARSTDANVQAVLRTAAKSAVSSAQLAHLTNEELGELRSSLLGLASSNVLGSNSVVSTNLRAIERESQSRAENARSERAVRVKVQAMAERAKTAALEPTDLALLRMVELQALRAAIESLVQSNPSLRSNEQLHATYDRIAAQISTQSLSSIASIAPAITEQTSAIVAALARAEGTSTSRLSSLSVPELKEVSLAVHRMARAAHNPEALRLVHDNLSAVQAAHAVPEGSVDSAKVQSIVQKALGERITPADLVGLTGAETTAVAVELSKAGNTAAAAIAQVAHDNLAMVETARAGRADGTLDSARVETVLAKAVTAPLAAQDLVGLSGKDIDAVSAQLGAIEALGRTLATAVAADSSSPEYKESVVNVHAELAERERRAAAGEEQDDATHDRALVMSLTNKVLAGETVSSPELVRLSMGDVRALNRFLAVVGEAGGDGSPIGPDSLAVSLAAIEHEQEQRRVLEKRLDAGARVQLASVYAKLRANRSLGPSDLTALDDGDLAFLHDRVSALLSKTRGEQGISRAVEDIQGELRARRLKELALKAAAQSPKVAELFEAATSGAELKSVVLAGLRLDDLRMLAEALERAASLLDPKVGTAPAFTTSLRRTESAFQKKSLAVLVQKVLEASPAAQNVLATLRAADPLKAAELENLSLPELEAVQAESYRLHLQAPAEVRATPVYQDNLALVTQVYDARVLEHAAGTTPEDGRFRFITGLQDAVGATLAQKIEELKAASKGDEADELELQQDDLGALVDRGAELAAERAEWIEYFRVTPVPKLEGIANRGQWIEAERALSHAIYEEIASQDWVLQAKGIADAAGNLLMHDTTAMTTVQILTALAVKEAAAGEALALVRADDELVLVPVAATKQAPAAATMTAPLRTFDD